MDETLQAFGSDDHVDELSLLLQDFLCKIVPMSTLGVFSALGSVQGWSINDTFRDNNYEFLISLLQACVLEHK